MVDYQLAVRQKQAQIKETLTTRQPSTELEKQFFIFMRSEYIKNQQSLNVAADMLEIQIENAKRNHKINIDDIRLYDNKHTKKTAVVVAFGASLRHDIDHLIKVKDKYLIVAVDRAAEYLMQRGVKPKYFVCCDCRSKAEWLGSYDYSGCVLLAFMGTSADYCERFVELGGQVSFFLLPCRVLTHLTISDIIGYELPLIPVSGNVSQAAVVLADFLLGCRKMLLLGFDYGHDGAWYYPDELIADTDQKVDGMRTITDITGQQFYTNDEFLTYILYLKEWIFERKLDDKVINCSTYGLLDIKRDKFINY